MVILLMQIGTNSPSKPATVYLLDMNLAYSLSHRGPYSQPWSLQSTPLQCGPLEAPTLLYIIPFGIIPKQHSTSIF